jgi:hypothetical protein
MLRRGATPMPMRNREPCSLRHWTSPELPNVRIRPAVPGRQRGSQCLWQRGIARPRGQDREVRADHAIVSPSGGDNHLVTSNNAAEAFNHGREKHAAHADRYGRAEKFAAVVNGLWDSWDEDAFIRDKASGVYYDTINMHVLNHRGPHFSVPGPLNVARPPQGRPVLVHAGASDTAAGWPRAWRNRCSPRRRLSSKRTNSTAT